MPRNAGIAILVTLCVACKPAPPRPARTADTAPKVRATVVTIRTTVQPENRVRNHTIVIAGDRARSTSEQDVWRLFDLKAKTVTFVDDIEKTIRTEPLDSIVTRRRNATRDALPPHYPTATFARNGTKKSILGVNAEEAVIESGAYRRQLWLGVHPLIPAGLFAAMHASEPVTSPLAPMMHAVDDALIDVKEFPLLDHAEVPYGKEKLVIERAVVGIALREVPETLLALPKGYRSSAGFQPAGPQPSRLR
jgi:hypothetical protein